MSQKKRNYLLQKKQIITLFFGLMFFSVRAFATDEEKTKFNPGTMIMHHIADSHEWHFASIGETHYAIPLPVILYTENGLDVFMSNELHHAKKVEHEEHGKVHHYQELKRGKNTYLISHDGKISLKSGGKLYDFSITKNVASLFISVILLLFFFLTMSKAYRKNKGKAPRGIQSFFEPVVIFVRDDIAKANIGEKHYLKYTPYLLTLFFFIWFNNLLGLLPGGANLTGNIAVTMVLAVLTFLITHFSAKKTYWKHIFAPDVPVALYIIMIPIEIIGVFTKPFALMVRLFANITAGHIIILSLLSVIFIFSNIGLLVAPVSLFFAIAMNCLELLIALLQAYVFTLLSAVYIGSAVEEHHHEAHGH